MKPLTRRPAVALSIGALILTAACGGAAVDGSSGGDEGSEPIRIAVVTAQSGSFAPSGALQLEGIEYAAKEANDAGGIDGRKVELFIADNRSTPEGSVAAAQRLVQRNDARFIIGTVASPNTLAVLQKLEAWDALQIGTQSQSNALTGEECSARFFRSNVSDAMAFKALEAWLEESKLDDWDAINPDYSFGHDSLAALESAMTKTGGKVDKKLFAPLATTDYAPQLSNLDGGDALLVSQAGSDAINLFEQAFDFGTFEKYDEVIGNAGVLTTSTFKAVTDDRLKGFWGMSNWAPTVDTEASRDFVANFEKEMDRTPSDGAGYAYIGMQTLFAGIEEAGSVEPSKVAKALEGLTYDTIKGEMTMRAEDHQAEQGFFVGRVDDTDHGLDLVIEKEYPADVVLGDPDPACSMG